MSHICVSGEALVDFVPDAQGHVQWTPGGSGLNTALALARLDIKTSFVGALSHDENGTRLFNLMRAENIDLASSFFSTKPCPHVIVSKDAQGVPNYDLYLASSALEDAPPNWPISKDTRHFHATSFAATLGACGAATLASLKEARVGGTVTTSFDPNIRTSVFPDRGAIPLFLAERIHLADIVKVSSEDLDALAPGILHDHIISEWRALGPKLLIITRGDKGAIALTHHHQIDVPAIEIDICDSVGAGDTFMGALLAAMAQEQCLGTMPDRFSADQLSRWLTFANQAAAFCCMRAGAQPPKRKDLERLH